MRRKLAVYLLGIILGSGTAMAQSSGAPIRYGSADQTTQHVLTQTNQNEIRMEPLSASSLGGPRELVSHDRAPEEPFSLYGGSGKFETSATVSQANEPVLYGGSHESPVWRNAPGRTYEQQQAVVHKTQYTPVREAYEIQIGSYREFANANDAMAKYSSVAPTRITHAKVRGHTHYRVMIAGGTTREAAEYQLATLQGIGVDGFVVTKK